MALLAIIMPVKNGEAHLQAALNSIAAQDTSNAELIVVNDGSTDNTAVILNNFCQQNKLPVKMLSTCTLGPAAARNIALKQTQCKFITFLDHDDTWPKERITSHLAQLDRDDTIDIVIGLTNIMPITKERRADFRINGNKLHNVNLGAATFKSSVFNTIGQFDEQLSFSEDHDLLFRAREAKLSLSYLNQVSLNYRLHNSNMTKDKTAQELGLIKVLRSSLQRRNKKQLNPFGAANL